MIAEVSRTLRSYLLAAIPQTGADWVTIASAPHETGESWPSNELVLFLYAIGEEHHLRNLGPRWTPDGYERQPLHVTLHYLVTYATDDHLEAQRRLDRVLRAFHTRPRLGRAELDPELLPFVDHLSVQLRTMNAEELNRLWTSLNQSMRLSLYYDVRVAPLEPLEQRRTEPVLEVRDLEEAKA